MYLILVFVGFHILLITVLALMLTYYFRVIRPKEEQELREEMDKKMLERETGK